MLSAGFIGILLVIFKLSTSLGYQTFFLHTSHYTSHAVPSQLDNTTQQQIIILVKNALSAIDFHWGVTHTEVKITPDGPKIIEINTRVAGDCIPELIYMTSGINLYQIACNLSLGRSFSPLNKDLPPFRRSAAIRFITAEVGKIVSIEGVNHVNDMLDWKNERIVIFSRIGDILPPVTSNLERIGYIIATGESTYEALERIKFLSDHIHIKVDKDYCDINKVNRLPGEEWWR